MSTIYGCPATVTRDGEDDACERPANSAGRFFEDEWDDVGWIEAACDRHAARFPLWDAIAKTGQWSPTVGSFVASAVTS